MYIDELTNKEGDAPDITPNEPAITGSRPGCGHAAMSLNATRSCRRAEVSTSLKTRANWSMNTSPNDRANAPNRGILMSHASAIGVICPVWGDSGCGLLGVR